MSKQFNAALAAMLDTITDVNIVRFDTFAFITDVVAHPAQYGFTNATQACYSGFVTPDPTATECSDPDAHVFWDGEHPTRVLHAILAEELYASVLHCEAIGRAKASDAADRPGFVSRCQVNVH